MEHNLVKKVHTKTATFGMACYINDRKQSNCHIGTYMISLESQYHSYFCEFEVAMFLKVSPTLII